jgi:hypothetical protein
MIDVKRRDEPRRRFGWPLVPAICVLLAFAGTFALDAVASEEALPEAEAILDGYIEATGGKAAYEKITNRVTKAKLEITAQGIAMNLTIYAARPNKSYMLIESEAIGTIEKGTDGTTVWEMSAMLGPQVKDGQEKIDTLREAMFDKFVNWREMYEKAECVGIEMLSEKPALKVVLTPRDGKPQSFYFDQASKLLVKVELTVENPMGTIPVETFLEDYRSIDGVLLPHKSRVVAMGQERVLTTESVEHNVELPPDRFDLPAEIRAILDGSPGESAPANKG